jgi:membrane protein DedA with SNARE-associated domain
MRQEPCALLRTTAALREALDTGGCLLRSRFVAALVVAPYIQQYGYWAVFLGTLLEGETILIIAGYSISRGYVDFLPVLLLAAAGGVVGDFFYFSLGRRYGPRIIRRFPGLRRVRSRAILLTRRWGRLTAFVTRFAYGLRVVLPMTMGAGKMRPPVFLVFNALGALAFAFFYLTLGYLFGEVLEGLIGRLRPYDRWIVTGIILLGVVVWSIRRWKLLQTSEEITRRAAEELRLARKRERRLERAKKKL